MKVSAALEGEGSRGIRGYCRIVYGDVSLARALWTELVFALFGSLPGAAGLFFRSKLYPPLFAACGRNVLFGRNVTFRHPAKIRLGDNVIIDDNVLLDAKGTDNDGIRLADHVFIGRNTTIYCKNGDMTFASRVSVSANCTLVSANRLTLGAGTVLGGYCYLVSGGEYDYRDPTPFALQSGLKNAGELHVGANCWLGAQVVVLSGSNVGDHCVIGAGAVVTGDLPADSLALGMPARVVKSIPLPAGAAGPTAHG